MFGSYDATTERAIQDDGYVPAGVDALWVGDEFYWDAPRASRTYDPLISSEPCMAPRWNPQEVWDYFYDRRKRPSVTTATGKFYKVLPGTVIGWRVTAIVPDSSQRPTYGCDVKATVEGSPESYVINKAINEAEKLAGR